MKTLNRPTRSKPPLPAPLVMPAQPAKTIEQMQAQQHDRMIQRGAARIAEQRRVRLELKKKAQKTQAPAISPKLSLPKVQPAVVASSATIPAPVFTEQTKAKVDVAVRALKGTRRLSERLTIAACHLRGDPVLAAIDPRELWRELGSRNK